MSTYIGQAGEHIGKGLTQIAKAIRQSGSGCSGHTWGDPYTFVLQDQHRRNKESDPVQKCGKCGLIRKIN